MTVDEIDDVPIQDTPARAFPEKGRAECRSVKPETRAQIAQIRQRWADEEQRKVDQREAEQQNLRDRLRRALLQDEKKFLSPCECDEFLATALEGREPVCAHFNGNGLFWFLVKQGF